MLIPNHSVLFTKMYIYNFHINPFFLNMDCVYAILECTCVYLNHFNAGQIIAAFIITC